MRQSPREPAAGLERVCHANALAGRAEIETDAPAQPGRARAEAVVPAFARVELADEVKEPSGRGIEVGRELGDLVAESIERALIPCASLLPKETLDPGFAGPWRTP